VESLFLFFLVVDIIIRRHLIFIRLSFLLLVISLIKGVLNISVFINTVILKVLMDLLLKQLFIDIRCLALFFLTADTIFLRRPLKATSLNILFYVVLSHLS
jgi:hypothetical protein